MSKKEQSKTTEKAENNPQTNAATATPADLAGKTGNELDNIRDILFGNQARATETRLAELATRVEAMRHELLNTINEQNSSTTERLTTKINDTKKDLVNRLKRQDEQQTTSLTQQVNKLSDENEQTRQDFQDSIDKLTADFQKQLLDTKKELQDGLNRLNTDLSERLLTMQAESQQRDNDLRQELLTMVAWLDNKKTTRLDLGQMLIEVGQQLQSNGEATTADTESE
ncbi:MAG: hypothetical protein DWQ04_02155 [Chloroflexi bacterium]|nr:MAG: hypothetical protein DWQ04_02155 [Chloroflexota bacterium]